MATERRCEVCGRPWDGGTLKPREIACQGCHGEYQAAIAEGKSPAEAKQDAKSKHEERERAAFASIAITRWQRVAAGFSAHDGTTPLAGSAAQIADAKARARKMLDDAGVA